MRNFVIRLFVNALALWIAAEFLDGITLAGGFEDVLWVALVFGIVNAVLKPILSVLALPLLFVTLGLFTLVINAALLLLTDRLTEALSVAGFGTAVVGSLVISIISMALAAILKDKKKD
ncbi:MAG: phage holin family protein [Gemmatimonadales bacterium]|jgi:putative membrane protein|nr:MAG: phage holin family protein [Gemmatimonadales bacterium]